MSYAAGTSLLNHNLARSCHCLFAHFLANAGELRHLIEAVDRGVVVFPGFLEYLQQIGIVLLMDDEVGMAASTCRAAAVAMGPPQT